VRTAPWLRALGALLLLCSLAQAQNEEKPSYLVGEVTQLDAAGTLALKAESAGTVAVHPAPNARFLRARPGATTLKDATPLAPSDIQLGDRVMVHGFKSKDGASFDAREVVVMTRGDIEQKREAELADWRKRGIVGVVTAVDKDHGTISVRLGRRPDAPGMVIETSGRPVAFKRYAPDSVRFLDARASSLGEIASGDELRALGEKQEDGARLAAEQIVTGSFRVITATVTAADAPKGEVMVKDDESGREVRVSVGKDARVRRLPPEMAQRLGRPPSPEAVASPGPRPRRGGEDLLSRLPEAQVSELKVGDRILVSSTRGLDEGKMNAIVVVLGLEAMPAAPAPQRRGRGTDVGMPADLMDLGLSLQ
jgi:hypothetical protein